MHWSALAASAAGQRMFPDGGAGYGTLYSIMALANILHYFGVLHGRAATALAATGLVV